MNIIQIFPAIVLMTHESLCLRYPHKNPYYQNIIVHERRGPHTVPRFDFSFDGIISSLTEPFRQTFFPSRGRPPIKRYSDPSQVKDYDYEELFEKRKQDLKNHKRFKSDIMMLIAKKKHADKEDELHPHFYFSTNVKDEDDVDRDDNFDNDSEDEEWRWPQKVTYLGDNPRSETIDKLFDVAAVGVEVRMKI